jgi:hypothetical protein
VSAHRPAYRMTVYAPRSVDPTEATVLTPAAGAPHSDPFKVITLQGVPGWQPYLGEITGRRGTLDPRTRKTTTGQLRIQVLDPRVTVGGSHASRWGTAFTGDSKERPALLGCKVYVEESLDGGSTWAAFFVGRIREEELGHPLWWTLTCRDFAEDFRQIRIFGGRPHAAITYAVEPLACPLGLSAAYGQMEATAPFTATVKASTHPRGFRQVELDSAAIAQAENLLTAAVLREGYQLLGGGVAILRQLAAGVGVVRLNPALRLRVSAPSLGIADKELQVWRIYPGLRTDGHLRMLSLLVSALQKADGSGPATTDPFYTPFDTGTVPDGTAITCSLRVVRPRRADRAGEDEGAADLFLSAVHPVAFWRDILDGYFGRLYQAEDDLPSGKSAGDPVWTIPYVAAAFTALLTPASGREAIPTSFWRLPKEVSALEFIEAAICRPYGLGYRFKPDGTGTPTCRLEPVDLRLPSAALLGSIPALTDADLDLAGPWPQWGASAKQAVTDIRVDYWTDTVLAAADVAALPETVPAVPAARVLSVRQYAEELLMGRAIDLGREPLRVDAQGIRGAEDPAELEQGIQRDAWAERAARRCIDHYRQLFGNGVAALPFRARRTANTTGLWPGDWCTADFSAVPNLSTNQRGGPRLYLILERHEVGPAIEFLALEAGVSSGTTAPTIGTPTQTANDPKHAIDVPVTLNASGDWVELRMAVQDPSYGSAAPADNDASWIPVQLVKATGTVTIRNLPSGKRVFRSGRSVAKVSTDGTLRKLPSAWTTPAGYVDTASYAAPSGVTVLPSPVLATSVVTASWTPGEGTLPVEVALDDGSTVRSLGRFAAGTVGPLTLNPYLAPNTSYTLKVRHLDGLGGTTAWATAAFATPVGFTGPALTVPTLTLLQGG